MSSGIVQLVSIGAQDEHIMGKPEISFFNSTFKRHTNFSQSVEKQTIQGAVKSNSLSTIRFERSGDLLGYTFIAVDDGVQALDIDDWTEIIDSIELLIGGHVIDEQDSFFTENIAIDTFAQNVSKSSNGPHPGSSARSYFYPLRFFFSEHPQSSIPLVSLAYHDVEIRIHWKNINPLYNFEVYSNYYYLDNAERNSILTKPRDLLIYQVQKNIPSMELVQDINFNHPVKFLASSNTSSSSATTSASNRIKIGINGIDINNYKWCKTHFVDVPYYFHTNFVTSPDTFLFPFCITTSALQPTGTLNFSRVDNVKIYSERLSFTDDIYAVNYNILRIENGMAGLRYAN